MPSPKRPPKPKPPASARDIVGATKPKPKKAPALAGHAQVATKNVVAKRPSPTPVSPPAADADAPLSRYHAKRDFRRTPEPAGAVGEAPGHAYVIHKHWASHLHYDLRLELTDHADG